MPQDAVLHDPWEHAAPGTRGKALVVEDDPAVLEVTVFLLQDLGYAVSTAITAAAALEIARQTAFDLVLSDISLPGDFNGIQLAKQLRQGHPDLPIILATGFTESFADAAGEFIVLRKPYRAEDLTTAISLEAR